MKCIFARSAVITAGFALLTSLTILANDEISLSYTGSALYSNYTDIVVVADKAYCVSPFGLVVFDVGNPAAPSFIAKEYLPYAEAIAVADNHAFVARGLHGLTLLDISNPADPVATGQCNTRGFAQAVEVSGNYAYVAEADSGLSVFDISNPSAPTFLAKIDLPGYANDVVLQGQYAYVASRHEGFSIINISAPGVPTLVKQGGPMTWSAKIQGNLLYTVGRWGSAQIWDVSVPATPQFVSVLSSGTCWALDLQGNLAFVVDSGKGIHIVDVTDPVHPSEASVFAPTGKSGIYLNVACANGFIYAVDQRYGLVVFQAINPQLPGVVGQLVAGVNFSIELAGDRVFLCQAAGGLRPINVADRNAPSPRNRVATPDWAYHSALQGNILYVACSFGGLQVFDVSGPGAPVLISSYPTNMLIYDVVVDGTYLYMTVTNTTTYGALQILNISDPYNPTLVSTFQTASAAWGICKQGQFCYVATDGLDIVNVSNPVSPFRAGFQGGLRRAKVVEVRGALALITDDFGLHLYNVYNPSQITLFSSMTQSPLWDFDMYYTYIFIAHDYLGMDVYDLADPAHPRFVDHWSFPGKIYDVKTDGHYLYLAAGSAFLVYRIDSPTDVRDGPGSIIPQSHALSQNYPNPFNSSTTIAYELATRQHVNISVYDILGRLVRTLVDDTRSAGSYRIDWDGTDASDRFVASGVYLYRIRTDAFHQARKMVLLK